MNFSTAVSFLVSSLAMATPWHHQNLHDGTHVLASGSPINVDMGHAAPFVHDWNGDGKRDLLVGQFHEGKLRVYPNVGADDNLIFSNVQWFEAGGVEGRVPSG